MKHFEEVFKLVSYPRCEQVENWDFQFFVDGGLLTSRSSFWTRGGLAASLTPASTSALEIQFIKVYVVQVIFWRNDLIIAHYYL